MGMIIKMPLLNVNDDSAVLVKWLHADGTIVRKGEPVCVVETTKTAVDICAEADGILRQLASVDETCAVGHPIGFLAVSADEPLPNLAAPRPSAPEPSAVAPQSNTTKKAEILAKRLGVDLSALIVANPGIVIGEEVVKAAAARGVEENRIASPAGITQQIIVPLQENRERVLILGGGGGAALVLDILSDNLTQQAVGILDNNPTLAGTMLMGVPILGGFDLAVGLLKEGKFDTLISTVVRDIGDRASIFERFTQLGIPFTNIIASSANVRSDARLGKGNLVVHGSYIATGVTLGDNNFLAAGTYIEHHSIIGSHCTFGPRTSLSGKVQVGDRVKFGTHVAVEPFIEIGSASVIASGIVLTTHVPGGSIVKNTAGQIIRHVK